MARNIAPQDISWFLDLNKLGRLDLNPSYQRKSVWSPKEQKYLIDTIFNNYPCPPLFLYKSISESGVSTYHVVDGKQRLETIIKFADNKLAIPNDFGDNALAGKKFKQLDIEQKKKFWNYQFAVESLEIIDSATVREIFDRYNRTSKNLNPQELRHAKYDGWFAKFAESEATKPEWEKYGIWTKARSKRMLDVQSISELMIEVLNKGDIIGFDHEKIEEYYANYDQPLEYDENFSEDEFTQRFDGIKNLLAQIETINGSITKYARTFTNFFSLWCILAGDSITLPAIEELAVRYAEFMERVTELSRDKNAQELLQGEHAEKYKLPFSYYENLIGAATEGPQRKARNEALSAYLLS
jgi:hypothetical protein